MVPTPSSLQEAVIFFADRENCRAYMVGLRWSDGVATCPNCGSANVKWLPNANLYKCFEKHPRQKFSMKVGTIFEDSPLGLEKWLPAVWLVANCKNGVSSWEIHRALGVTQKTAWFMLHRIRLAMQDEGHGGKLGGTVEIDETYIGGKARNMHSERRKRILGGKTAGVVGKIGVQGMLQRGGKIRAEVIADAKLVTLIPNVAKHVEKGSTH
jgi:transposase-like protein